MTDQTDRPELTPAQAAVRAFRVRMAAAAGGALLLTFLLLVWASPGPSPDTAEGPSTTLTLAPPPEPSGPPASPPPPDDAPAEPVEESEPEGEPDPPPTPTEPAEPEEPEEPAADEPAPPAVEPGPGAPLWGRWYRAVYLREGDQTAVVAGERPLYVGFLRDPDRDAIVWMTSCNTFGADLVVEERRLRLAELGGSTADCEDENLADQELWLLELFAADPSWRHVGTQLRVWSGDRRIDLVEDARGPGPPWT